MQDRETLNATMAALRAEMAAESVLTANCKHAGQKLRKYDNGRCPLLCIDCRLIIGYWTEDGDVLFSEENEVFRDEVEPEIDPAEAYGNWLEAREEMRIYGE